jgi:hypothetical protein
LGVDYAEAPMTRPPAHAERGEVNVPSGGDTALLDRLRPGFAAYAKNVFHVGLGGARDPPEADPQLDRLHQCGDVVHYLSYFKCYFYVIYQ